MGDRLTGETETQQTEHRTYGEIFDELFPHYLLMGMTPEQYWDGESGLKRAYRKMYQIKVENEQRLADRNNWYMGQYIVKALNCVPLLVAGLNVKSSTRLPQYPEKPFLEQAEILKKEEDRKKQEEDRSKMAMAMFQAMVSKFNKRFEKEQKPEPVSTGQ